MDAEPVRATALCPRQDMLGEIAAQDNMRKIVKKLPRYVTFDHSFHSLREDEKYWYLKTKPIRNEKKTELEEHLALTSMMQRSEGSENVRKDKLKPEDYNILADAVGRALPIPSDILRKNSLEKRIRTHGDLQNLRSAAAAAKASSAGVSLSSGPPS